MSFSFQLREDYFLPHLACDIDFSLDKGEGMLFTGPNGLGKTTLLRRLFEKYRANLAVSLVEQGPLEIFYDRKVGEVRRILYRARIDKVDDEAFSFLWEKLGLLEKEDRYLSELSGGELQSLKLALGLGKKSDLYFLDEPLQSLDRERKVILAGFLEEHRRAGASFIVVEHDLAPFKASWRAVTLAAEEGLLRMGNQWTT